MVAGDLATTAERFARDREPSLARLIGDDRTPTLTETWNQAARLGWTGVLIAPELGGAGGDVTDFAAIVHGLGRQGLPLALHHCGSVAVLVGEPQPGMAGIALLRSVSDGSARVCALIDAPDLVCRRGDGKLVFSGRCEAESVPQATHYLAGCRDENGGMAVLCVAANSRGVVSEAFDRADGGVGVRVAFSGVEIASADVVVDGPAASSRLETASALHTLLTCVEAEAAIGALLENSIQYLLRRVQFSAPLAELQVLRHKVVDIYLANQTLHALASRSLRTWTMQASESRRTIALTRAHLLHVNRAIVKSGIQLHGGMGLCEDMLAARLCKRLLMMDYKLTSHPGERHAP